MAVAVVSGFTWVNDPRQNANFIQGKGTANSPTINTKGNTSVGELSGNLVSVFALYNVIFDTDAIDTPIMNNEVKPSIGPSIVEAV
jgi:hypothetical protein